MFALGSGYWPVLLFSIDWGLRLLLAGVVISRRRPVAVTLAWLAVLVFVPVIGLIAYVLVGENRLGRRRIRRYEVLTKGIEVEAVRVWHHRHLDSQGIDEMYAPIARFGLNATGFPPLRNNRLSCLNNTSDFIDCVCADIAAAKHHVHIQTYIWQPTGAGVKVAQCLIDASKRGVLCRVLVDAVGSKAFLASDLPRRLNEAGVRVVQALPANILRAAFQRLDLRNHRKIIVVDGRVAYAGSQNITDTMFRSAPHRRTGPWVDASLRIEGPAVYALQAVFLRDWMLDSDEAIGALDQYIPPVTVRAEHPCVVQVIPSGPGAAPDAIHQAILTTIYSARDELVMTTPYFVPDDATRTALQAAAMRGVSVTLVMPKVSDSRLVAAASRAHYLDLLESGVKIHHYRGGLLHAKTMTVDKDICLIGSANMDARSFWLNFEVTLFIYDDDFSSAMRFLQGGYLAESDEVHLEEWRLRPRWEVFRDNVAQLLGPLL